jgi:NIPSNAP
MFTCFIRYTVRPDMLEDFEAYARAWMPLIEKYGGTHHGYFVPPRADDEVPDPTFSFPGLGTRGPDDIAVALFSFPSLAAYDAYRHDVKTDPACAAATARFEARPCFASYERTFLKPV